MDAKQVAVTSDTRKTHQLLMRKASQQMQYLKAKCLRESGFRADLIYQKKYLLLLLGGADAWYFVYVILVNKQR